MSASLRGSQRRARWFWLALITFFVVGFAGVAQAAQVKWKRTTIDEVDGSWKIDMTVFLNKAPSVAHVPVRFAFTPEVVYERSLVDGKDEPVLTKLPLGNQQPLVESVDVGFLDPGTGKIQNRTRFSFRITREHGFMAGEYSVEIRQASNNSQLGGATRLILQGENEVVDRRSMVFEAKDKKEKQSEDDARREKPQEKKLTPDDEAFWAGGPEEPDPEEDPELPPPASVRDNPGACGCRLVGGSATGAAGVNLLLAALLVGGLTGRRRLRS